MERNQIINKLNEIFEDVIDKGPVSLMDATTSKDVVGWDSLTNVQLVVDVERYFNIRFSSEDIISWRNIGEMIDSIIRMKEQSQND